jgi:peptidoglycan biosynthesis protein MviN/MurJ (putative lipid II flippase)
LSPLLIKILAPGYASSADNLPLFLLRGLLPYILLIGWTALGMGVAHSLGIFTPSATAPILLNLGMILGVVVLSRFFQNAIDGATPAMSLSAAADQTELTEEEARNILQERQIALKKAQDVTKKIKRRDDSE